MESTPPQVVIFAEGLGADVGNNRLLGDQRDGSLSSAINSKVPMGNFDADVLNAGDDFDHGAELLDKSIKIISINAGY